jgi:hypothetical protein
MKRLLYLSIFLCTSCVQAQVMSAPDTVIKNLEYVTVKYITGKQKLYHVQYLIKKGNAYYYPNMYPVEVINYKKKDSVEVIVRK